VDLSDQRYDSLTHLVYETLEDRQAWPRVFETLREATDARAIHLLAIDKRHGALSYSDGAAMAPQIDLEYIQKYQFIDPRLKLILEKHPREWVHCHEHFDDVYVANDPFYQEFLLPHGARYLSSCKLLDDSEATVILACLRAPDQSPFPPEAIAFLDRLLPHMARACRAGVKNFIYSTQALVGHALVNKLRQPVVLMTTTGEVVQTNEAANRLLETTRLIRISDGQLQMPERYRQSLLAQCALIEGQVRSGAVVTEGAAPFTSLQIVADDAEGADEVLYGFFTTLVPEQVMGTFGLRPLVMLFFYHPGSAPPIDVTLLAAAFGLTNAECRIAAMLAEGMSLKQIAETLGVQHDTVRKQLQSVYKKTATNRQPELVRLLLHLPANAAWA